MFQTDRLAFSPPTGVALEAPQYSVARQDMLHERWFEVQPEFLMGRGGVRHRDMKNITYNNVVSFHCAGLSIGDACGMDADYLARLKALIDSYDPVLVSGYAAWRQHGAIYIATPLPMLYSPANLDRAIRNVVAAQTALDRRILVENLAHFGRQTSLAVDEAAFFNLLARTGECGLLLSIKNMIVTCRNLGLSAQAYLDELDPAIVGAIHLPSAPCGKTKYEQDAFADDVWLLYERALDRFGQTPTVVENNGGQLPLGELLRQSEEIAQIQNRRHDMARNRRVA